VAHRFQVLIGLRKRFEFNFFDRPVFACAASADPTGRLGDGLIVNILKLVCDRRLPAQLGSVFRVVGI
jgi:hypothetical protein